MIGRLARRVIRRAARGAATAVEIEGVCRELAEWNRSSESDFLRVLQSLQALLARAQKVSGECSSLVEILQSEQAARAERDLRSTLARAAEVRQSAGAGLESLAEAGAAMQEVETTVGRLGQAVREFQVLGAATRIECARAGADGAEFEGVAEEVAQLAADLREKSEHMQDACAGVRRTVRDAIGTASKMDIRRAAALPRILEEAAASLEALSWKNDQASLLSRDLAAEYAAVSSEIGEMVAALQYHDITRQQVEHVMEALRETGGPGDRAAPDAEKAAAAVALLQAAQLRSAGEQFRQAVERIRVSLGRIAAEVRKMAERPAALLDGGGNGAGKYFRELEEHFASVAGTLSAYADSTAALGLAAGTATAAVARIAEFAGEIDFIGLRMHRVSLNANVRAARLGTDGAALAAVAVEIQSAVGRSNAQAGCILAAIEVAARSVERLRREGEDSAWRDAREAAGGLGRMQAALEDCATQAGGRLAAIAEAGRALADDVAELGRGFEAAASFAEVMERGARALDRAGAPAGPGAGMAAHVSSLEKRYTMAAERSVHEDLVDHRGGEAAERMAGPPAADEMVENVEFF